VGAVETGDLDGYAGLTVEPDKRSLTLYWHGRLPRAIEAIKSSASRENIAVRVVAAPYDRGTLRRAQREIATDPAVAQGEVVQIEINTDGSGLAIGTAGSVQHVRALESVRNSRVPVTVYKESTVIPLSRWNDTSPYWGGAAIQSLVSGYSCSTAFGVHYGTDPDLRMMLTAAHCISDLGEMWSNGSGTPIGPVYGFDKANDAAYINTSYFPASSSGDRTYTGLTDPLGIGTGERSNRVVGFAFNYVGDVVRSSGAFSGERGNIKITNVDVMYFIRGADGTAREVFGIEAEQIYRQNAFGQGDSGGPIFTYANGPVKGRGIISAGYTDSETSCTGITGTRRCFWRVLFTDLFTVLDYNNLVLN
jgi:hypothetical protein